MNTWMDQYDLVNMWMDQYDLVNMWMDQYKVVNTWMDQYKLEVVMVYHKADVLKQCNEAMLQVYSLVRGTKQGMVYHLADVLKQCNEAMLQVYSLVRRTKEEVTWVQGDVRHAGQVVDVFYSLVRGTRTRFILGNVGMYHKLYKGDYSRGLGSDSSREVDNLERYYGRGYTTLGQCGEGHAGQEGDDELLLVVECSTMC